MTTARTHRQDIERILTEAGIDWNRGPVIGSPLTICARPNGDRIIIGFDPDGNLYYLASGET